MRRLPLVTVTLAALLVLSCCNASPSDPKNPVAQEHGVPKEVLSALDHAGLANFHLSGRQEDSSSIMWLALPGNMDINSRRPIGTGKLVVFNKSDRSVKIVDGK